MLQFGDAFEQFRAVVPGRQIVAGGLVFEDRPHHAAARGKDRLENGQAVVELRILGQKGERLALCPNDAARVGFLKAGDDLEQRRFARPVGADDADLILFVEAQRHALEQRFETVVLRDVFERDDIHNVITTLAK